MATTVLSLRKKLDNFKEWVEAPRMYVVEELDSLKNEIDIKVEELLMKIHSIEMSDVEKNFYQEKINSDRKLMIDEVSLFETKIFDKLTSNELEEKFAKKLAAFIKKLEAKLQILEHKQTDFTKKALMVEVSNLEQEIDASIYEFDCKIKQKSSVLFLNM